MNNNWEREKQKGSSEKKNLKAGRHRAVSNWEQAENKTDTSIHKELQKWMMQWITRKNGMLLSCSLSPS